MQVIAHEPIESYARQRTSCALVRHLGDFVRSDLGLGIAPKSTHTYFFQCKQELPLSCLKFAYSACIAKGALQVASLDTLKPKSAIIEESSAIGCCQATALQDILRTRLPPVH